MLADALAVVAADAGNLGMVMDMQAAQLGGQAALLGLDLGPALGRGVVVVQLAGLGVVSENGK